MRKWSGKIRDVRGYCNDCFDDFCVTVEEVVNHKSLPQILGVITIVAGFAVVTIVLWAVLSFLLALPVWWLWNAAMPDIGVPEIGYWNAYCLTLLCAILFRGNSVHLKE